MLCFIFQVHIGCWNSSEEIINYMKLHKYPRTIEGFTQLWTEFHNKALQTWDATIGHSNTKVVLWTSDLTKPETITSSLDKDRYNIFFSFSSTYNEQLGLKV